MDLILKYEESIVFALRSLYSKYGYTQYKMNKFEEYDLYVKNRDFLISDSIITFTDTNGKLMALKPDVTLSMVKNSRDIPGYVEKLYYNENVYRISKGTKAFKEIMQVGLECMGAIDPYCISEVISLAAQSLKAICERSVLCISHLGILSAALDAVGIPTPVRGEIFKCIEEKSEDELKKLCAEQQLGQEAAKLMGNILSTYGSAGEVLPRLKSFSSDPGYLQEVARLEEILALVDHENMVQIDFSMVGDTKYYNGIVFKGFVEGVANSVLSGGQYDRLMRKMSRSSGAIGFAVYLDMLDPLKQDDDRFQQDVVVLYDDTTDMAALKDCVKELISQGNRVSAQRSVPERLTYRKLMKLKDGEVEVIENNA